LVLLQVKVAAFHSGLNRLVSVALFLAFEYTRTGVTRYLALWSPDFPLPAANGEQRPPGQLRGHIIVDMAD
jgi:hypothetical protein